MISLVAVFLTTRASVNFYGHEKEIKLRKNASFIERNQGKNLLLRRYFSLGCHENVFRSGP